MTFTVEISNTRDSAAGKGTDPPSAVRLTLGLILTRSPDSINMCMLVFLLTTAFCPPRTGVGGSRRQLWGGRRGSGAGAAGFLSITVE